MQCTPSTLHWQTHNTMALALLCHLCPTTAPLAFLLDAGPSNTGHELSPAATHATAEMSRRHHASLCIKPTNNKDLGCTVQAPESQYKVMCRGSAPPLPSHCHGAVAPGSLQPAHWSTYDHLHLHSLHDVRQLGCSCRPQLVDNCCAV